MNQPIDEAHLRSLLPEKYRAWELSKAIADLAKKHEQYIEAMEMLPETHKGLRLKNISLRAAIERLVYSPTQPQGFFRDYDCEAGEELYHTEFRLPDDGVAGPGRFLVVKVLVKDGQRGTISLFVTEQSKKVQELAEVQCNDLDLLSALLYPAAAIENIRRLVSR